MDIVYPEESQYAEPIEPIEIKGVGALPEEPAPAQNVIKPGVETMLVRMDRKNGIYETRGVTFTRDHPYALVDLDTAQDIFDNEEGFRPATPRELQEFYS